MCVYGISTPSFPWRYHFLAFFSPLHNSLFICHSLSASHLLFSHLTILHLECSLPPPPPSSILLLPC
jgi:hypothetical protein